MNRWFSLSTPVSPTAKTDRHDITELLLKHHNSNPNTQIYSVVDFRLFVEMVNVKLVVHEGIIFFLHFACLLPVSCVPTVASVSGLSILDSRFGFLKEEFEDTKGVNIIRKSMKDRQHNGQNKKAKRINKILNIKLRIE